MPITTSFDSTDFHNSVRNILREHLLDYFPAATYVITDEPPAVDRMTKPIIWLSLIDAENLDWQRARRGGKSLQRKRITYGVSLFTNANVASDAGPANLVRRMAASFERNAVLRDGYKLAQAGLSHANITPFVDVNDPTETRHHHKYAALTFDVYVEAS